MDTNCVKIIAENANYVKHYTKSGVCVKIFWLTGVKGAIKASDNFFYYILQSSGDRNAEGMLSYQM